MTEIFNGDFTSGWKSRTGPISNFLFSCIVAADRFQALPSFQGRANVGKFIIKPGDMCNVTNTDERCQVMKAVTSSIIGTTQWFAFSFMLDPTWTSNGYIKSDGMPSNWFMLWEFGWPTQMLNISMDNKLEAFQTKGTTVSTNINPTLAKGSWYDVLMRQKFSYGSDGIFEVWIKKPGESTYSIIHYSTGVSAEAAELAHQLGPYRGKSSNTQIVYIADYKVGTTRADVEYRSGPLQPPVVSFTVRQ